LQDTALTPENLTNKPLNMNQNKPRKNNLLSFNIDEAELKNQILNYSTLKINKSYKGISTLVILAISLISVFATFYFGEDVVSIKGACFGIAIYLFIALFIYKGRRWAIILAMIFWTLDKAVYTYQIVQAGFSSNVIVVLFLWIAVMRFFWRALEVENYRKELANLAKENPVNIDNS
jgi:hypothetical protein